MTEKNILISSLITEAWEGTDIEKFKMLLESLNREDFEKTNERGQTALFCAARNGHVQFVLELLKVQHIPQFRSITALHSFPFSLPTPLLLAIF